MIPYTRVITPAEADAEPVSLDAIKLHLRIDGDTSEDAWLKAAITSARAACEDFTNRFIAVQGIEFRAGCWPSWQGGQVLPGSDPASEVVVKYVDTDGDVQTVDADQYALTWGAPSKLINSYQQHWPQARLEPGAIRVQYVAGWAPADVPAPIKHAVMLMVGEWYENRENAVIGASVAEIPNGCKALLWPYRISLGV